MTPQERERAMLVSLKEYPQDMPCMVCSFRWMQHKGTLCPQRPGYFSQALGIAIAPVMADSTFIPDVSWEKPPNFDAV